MPESNDTKKLAKTALGKVKSSKKSDDKAEKLEPFGPPAPHVRPGAPGGIAASASRPVYIVSKPEAWDRQVAAERANEEERRAILERLEGGTVDAVDRTLYANAALGGPMSLAFTATRAAQAAQAAQADSSKEGKESGSKSGKEAGEGMFTSTPTIKRPRKR